MEGAPRRRRAPVTRRENNIDFVTGRVEGHDVVLVLSGMSMVNAAMTAQMAIDRYNLRAILFSGVAGGVDPSLNIGDVVVAERWGNISTPSSRARRRRVSACRNGRSRNIRTSA